MDEITKLHEQLRASKTESRRQETELRKQLIDKDAVIGDLEDEIRELKRRLQQRSSTSDHDQGASRDRQPAVGSTSTSVRGNDLPRSGPGIDSSLNELNDEGKYHDLAKPSKDNERAQRGVQRLPSPVDAVESRKRHREAALTDQEDYDDLYLDHNATGIKLEASKAPTTPPYDSSDAKIGISRGQVAGTETHTSSSSQEEEQRLRSPLRKRQKIDCVITERAPSNVDDRAVSAHHSNVQETEVGDQAGASSASIEVIRPLTLHEERSISFSATTARMKREEQVTRRLALLASYAVSDDPIVFYDRAYFLKENIEALPVRLCTTVRPTSSNLPINKNGDRSEWSMFFPKREVNLYLPRRPGQPGLLCMMRTDLINGKPWSLFCKKGVNGVGWGYYGDYVLKQTEPLTAEEWNLQSPGMHHHWGQTILTRKTNNWGPAQQCRARIALRKQGVALSESAIINEMKKRSHLEVADVHEALRKGEEQLGVVQMDCINFDHQFHRSLADLYSGWTNPHPKAS